MGSGDIFEEFASLSLAELLGIFNALPFLLKLRLSMLAQVGSTHWLAGGNSWANYIVPTRTCSGRFKVCVSFRIDEGGGASPSRRLSSNNRHGSFGC